MVNGHTAVRLLDLPATSDPQLGGAEGWVERDSCIALMDQSTRACAEMQNGGLTGQTKAAGGDLLGRLCVLQSKVGAREFATAMRRAGRRPTRHGAPLVEAAIDDVIAIVTEITAAVREMN